MNFKTKLAVLLVNLVGLPAWVYAQNESLADMYEFNTPQYTGGYFAPVVKQSKFLDQNGYLVGARGAVIFNEAFMLGASGYKLVSDDVSYYDSDRQLDRNFTTSYGGLLLGWNFFPRNVINFSFLTNISWGSVKLRKPNDDEELNEQSAYDSVQVIEPELMVDVNITRNVRAGVGYGYRFVRGVDFKELTKDDVQSSVGIIAVSLYENVSTAAKARF